jgi:hypothetical protein
VVQEGVGEVVRGVTAAQKVRKLTSHWLMITRAVLYRSVNLLAMNLSGFWIDYKYLIPINSPRPHLLFCPFYFLGYICFQWKWRHSIDMIILACEMFSYPILSASLCL